MIRAKTKEEIQRMREACRIAAQVLHHMQALTVAGVTTRDLDEEARRCMTAFGARSACLNYRINSRTPAYPSHTCISINEEVIHGIASPTRIVREGDLVSLDVVVWAHGMVGDNAATVAVGAVSPEKRRLLEVTAAALTRGIEAAKVGHRVGDISASIQSYVESHGFSVVREFVGHGVGLAMHEEPQVPNFGRRGSGERLRSGLTLAIEPMVAAGRPEVDILPDGWTAVTRDRRPSCHFEHTVLLTDDGPEILTRPPA